jgi:septum formation protein
MIKKKIVLGSQSPRRSYLLEQMGLEFEIRTQDAEEIFPEAMHPEDVPAYLARLKAKELESTIQEEEVLITADTVVIIDDKVVGKPTDAAHAFEMVKNLSNKVHKVVTGVTITDKKESISFSETTYVVFRRITDGDIKHYLHEYKPFDKAGAYGIQEWIGVIGIEKIDGCYYNVMGLPTSRLYLELNKFVNKGA